MSLVAAPYRTQDASDWDNLVAASTSGTFLHTRRFIAYHGDRFVDRSLCFRDGRGQLLGILPAAVSPDRDDLVVSHPGLTYGGLIHSGRLTGASMLEALQTASAHFAGEGFKTLRYKAVPSIYHALPAADDLYALFRMGARRVRCDLGVAVALDRRLPVSGRRKRGLKKAASAELTVSSGKEFLPGFWDVLEETLQNRHGVSPVHTLAEIETLQQLFPDEIEIVVALEGKAIVAGTVIFRCPTVHHAQYIAASPRGQDCAALDLLFDRCISRASREEVRFFDFGTCTEQDGQFLNEGLYGFKAEFGGAGTIHEFFDLDLT